jgi:alkylhydroperoxidase family enzyme
MTAPRVTLLPVDEAKAAAVAAGLDPSIADLAIFQVLLRHPALAVAINDFLQVLLFKGSLDPRLRELMIMRVGWQTGSVYEWVQHWRIAPSFGVSEADLAGVREWRDHDAFGPAERAVLAAVDEALSDGAISEATWDELRANVEAVGGVEAILEVPVVVGGWAMISKLLQSVEVPIEPGLTDWPPDGRGPDFDGEGGTA